MTSITSEYLLDIITRCISKNIIERRKLSLDSVVENFIVANNEELTDFILSIPYFDTRLKDFLLGNINVPAIIISQNWENEFIKKCSKWASDKEWLNPRNNLFNKNFQQFDDDRFTLPY